MEWKDYERNGEVIGSVVTVGRFRIDVTSYNEGWWMLSTAMTYGHGLDATDLAQAKTEAAAIVRVALEEALAALVGG